MNTKILVTVLVVVLLLFVACYSKSEKRGTRAHAESYGLHSDKIDMFESHEEKSVIVFLSTTCPHCVSFDRDTYDGLSESLKKMDIGITKIYSNNDPDNLFDKLGVQYVPSVFVFKGDVGKQVSGPSTAENIVSTLKTF